MRTSMMRVMRAANTTRTSMRSKSMPRMPLRVDTSSRSIFTKASLPGSPLRGRRPASATAASSSMSSSFLRGNNMLSPRVRAVARMSSFATTARSSSGSTPRKRGVARAAAAGAVLFTTKSGNKRSMPPPSPGNRLLHDALNMPPTSSPAAGGGNKRQATPQRRQATPQHRRGFRTVAGDATHKKNNKNVGAGGRLRPFSLFAQSPRRHRERRGPSKRNLKDVFDVQGIVGQGAFGTVSRAQDRTDGRRVAIKTINEQSARAEAEVEMEMVQRVHAGASRPEARRRVMQILGMHEDEDGTHLVSDLYEGGDACDLVIDNADRMSAEAAKRLTREMLEGVKACHDADVMHLDVKPENFMLKKAKQGNTYATEGPADEDMVIIDFGSAHAAPSCPESEIKLRSKGDAIGTALFAAPEIRHGYASKKADMWSAGVSSYLAMTQRMPWREDDHPTIEAGKYATGTANYKKLCRQGKDFLAKLIHPDPAKRMDVDQALAHPYLAVVAN